MRIAYIITTHKLPDQLVRLVKRLDTDGVSFFIHVDKKTDGQTYKSMVDPLRACANVSFLERCTCNWGDFGVVRATLTGIEQVLTCGVQFDYVILITGQDYPIKSNRHIQRFLEEGEGRSFIHYFTKQAPWAGKWDERHLYWHFLWGRRHFAFPKADMFETPALNRVWNVLAKAIPLRRKMPEGLEPFYGSAYWCLSRECVEYIHQFAQQKRAFTRFFRHVAIPDEEIFQTILLNSTFKERLVNDDLVYADFSQHLAHPATLGKNDFNRLMGRSELFARKFDATVDGEVLDMIDAAIS
jgi:hypothetical protein